MLHNAESVETLINTDYYNLDDGVYTDEEKAVRDSVREWVDRRVIPIIDDHAQKATFPTDLIKEMAELGFFGATLPEKYGCAGLNNVATA
jgi:Acyl-CoA dehydrogenases